MGLRSFHVRSRGRSWLHLDLYTMDQPEKLLHHDSGPWGTDVIRGFHGLSGSVAAVVPGGGAPHGAGCILFVREGRLAMLEGFSYDDEWPENAAVLAVSDVVPLDPTRDGLRSDPS
jgi:hypothetical protein